MSKTEEEINDSMRDRLDLSLHCSRHPIIRLNMSPGLSKMGASSAYEVNMRIMVHPCHMCDREYEMLKDSIQVILKAKDDKE